MMPWIASWLLLSPGNFCKRYLEITLRMSVDKAKLVVAEYA